MLKTLKIMALIAISSQVNAQTVSIGNDAACDYNTSQGGDLQTALNNNPSEVRLVSNITHTGQFIVNSSVNFRGGYNNCSDANADIPGNGISVLNGNFQGVTLTIENSGAYQFENIQISNGSNPTNRGGGLLIKASDSQVSLINVIINNNEAKWGGGIFKGSNLNVELKIKDSIIFDNFAGFGAGLGGGIYYDVGGALYIYGETQIIANEATNGGGIFLDNAQAWLVGGENAAVNSGLSGNKATEHGGGIFAQYSSLTISGGKINIPGEGDIGTSGKNYIIASNQSDIDQNNLGDGGGLYLVDGSAVSMEGVTIATNHSNASGGGMVVIRNASVDISRPIQSSCQETNLMGCNFFVQNTSKNYGGGMLLESGGNVLIKATNISNNRANFGTAAFVSGNATQLRINASVLYENGNNGGGDYADRFVIMSSAAALVEITQSTAAKNNAESGFISVNNASLNSYHNYFFNDLTGPWLTENQNSLINYDCMIVDDTQNSGEPSQYLYAHANLSHDSYFVDTSNHNYHLTDNSFLIDLTGFICVNNQNVDPTALDIDGDPRTAYMDFGADENLSNDIIFTNGFESAL